MLEQGISSRLAQPRRSGTSLPQRRPLIASIRRTSPARCAPSECPVRSHRPSITRTTGDSAHGCGRGCCRHSRHCRRTCSTESLMTTWCSSTCAPTSSWTSWNTRWRRMRTDSAASSMLDEMSSLRAEMLDAETLAFDGLADLPEQTHASARNLLHYLALRRHDLRGLQQQLEAVGLSTLEGAESRALENVDAVLGILQRLDLAAPWRSSP